jgi:hypothetical protein
MISCENPITGFGPQPVYLEKGKYKPMLNIFGVLRPDSLQGFPNSFVHLEAVYPICTSYPDSFELPDATVKVYCYEEAQISDSLQFVYTNFDSIFSGYEYRALNFIPVEKRIYGISCYKQGYLKLTGKTRVPLKPVIVNDTIMIDHNKISFAILTDSTAVLYDISLTVGELELNKRMRKPEQGNIVVTFNLYPTPVKTAQLVIFAYDLNLSEYLTYNISIKPNTYQGNYSTVENGYGCFGSLNILRRTIDLEKNIKETKCIEMSKRW